MCFCIVSCSAPLKAATTSAICLLFDVGEACGTLAGDGTHAAADARSPLMADDDTLLEEVLLCDGTFPFLVSFLLGLSLLQHLLRVDP